MGKKRFFSAVMTLCLLFSVVMPSEVRGEVKADNAAQAAEAVVLDATEYGADPGGVKDSALAIQKVIAAAKEQEGPVIIDFPKGEYQIYPDKIEARELYITNTVGTNQSYKMKKIGFLFEDMENVTLRGNGSMFMFHGKMTTFATINSKNVHFEDFSFDFRTPTVIDVTVESTDGNTATMYVPECYDYSVSGTTVTWKSDVSPYTGNLYWTTQNGMAYKQVYDIQTGMTTRDGSELFGGVTAIEDIGNHRLKFTYSSRPNDITDGKCYQMRPKTRDHAGMFFWKSDGVTLDHVNVHFLHGFGIVGQHSSDLTLDNVIFEAPEGSGRTTVGYADFIQMSGCKGKVTIQNCSFSNPHDDPINVHGTYNKVVEKIAGNKFKVHYEHGETAGFPNYFEGDEVEFAKAGNMISVPDSVAKVIKVEGPTGQNGAAESGSGSLEDIIITLDRNVPDEIVAGEYVVENITYTPEVLIQNNVFKETPTRGVLVTTRKKVEIKNNVFDGLGMASIYISADAQEWWESGPVKDVTIEGNTFYRPTTSAAVIFVEPTNPTVSTNATVHDNIKIKNNDFYVQNGQVLNAKSVNGISFTNNRIYRYDPNIQINFAVSSSSLRVGDRTDLQATATGRNHASNLYSFNGCKNVVISGNTYDGGLKLGGSKSKMSDSDITNDDGIAIGGSATELPAVGMISYETDENDGVIRASHDGKVIALKNGTAKVRAYTIVGGRKFVSDWQTITVGTHENASITISAEGNIEVTQEHEEEIQYTAVVTPAEAVTWSVKDAATGMPSEHATIDGTGKLTTVSDGAVEVVASTASGLEASKLLVINKGESLLGKGIQIDNPLTSGAEPNDWKITDIENTKGIRVETLHGGLWDTQTAHNIFYHALESSDNVIVTVKMSGKTAKSYEEAGLVLFKDQNNYVFVGRKHAGGTPRIKLMYQCKDSNVGSNESQFWDAAVDAEAVYFKLEKENDTVKASFSLNGLDGDENWNVVGTSTNVILGSQVKAGFYAADGNEATRTPFVFSDLKVKIGDGEEKGVPLAYANVAPSASDVSCSYGNGGALSAQYVFADNNEDKGDEEGASIVKWMSSSAANGTYSLVSGLSGKEVTAPADLAGKYVKAVVIPQDSNGLYGAPVESAAVQVGTDAANLPTAISITGGKGTTQTIGEEISYHAAVTPENASGTVSWSVMDAAGGDTAPATIDQNGTLTPVSNGVAEVVATTSNGLEARKLLVINQDEAVLAKDFRNESPDNAHWSFSETGSTNGKIRIQAQPGGLWEGTNSAKNIFSHVLESSDNVEVSVKLSGKASGDWDEAGLLLFTDTDNYVAIGRKNRQNGNVQIRLTKEVSGTGNEGDGPADVSGDDVYLKLVKAGATVTGYFSENGNVWTERRAVDGITFSGGLKVGFYTDSTHNTVFEFSELKVDGKELKLFGINTAPSASGSACAVENGMLHADLNGFADSEGDAEGTPLVRWLAASEENGTYELVPGLAGNDIYVPASMVGMYVKAVVIPQDERGLYGAPAEAAAAVHVGESASVPASESALASASITGAGSFGEFSSATKSYMTTATASQHEVTASFEAKDSRAVIEVSLNNEVVIARGQNKSLVENLKLPLVSGRNQILVTVIAEDEETQTEYRFVISKTGDNNAKVTGIALNNEPLSGFSADTLEYDYAAAAGASSIAIAVATESNQASVEIRNSADGKSYPGKSAAVSLVPGLNTIVITVRPETLVPEKRYQIAVAVPKASNANLKSLIIPSGVTLQEEFSARVKTYEGTATLAEVSVQLQAEESGAGLEVLLDNESVGTGTGSLDQNVTLHAGMNELKIKVTSPDGAVTETYALNIRGIGKVMMSDLDYAEGSASGWGNLMKNLSVEGNPIRLLGEDGEVHVYASGIGGHANMTLIYNIKGMGFTSFAAYMGLDQEANHEGSIKFAIYLDNSATPVWTSGDEAVGKTTPAKYATVDVSGVEIFEIRVDSNGADSNDHASIGDATFFTAFVDKEELLKAISDAKKYTQESLYTQGSWSALQTALSAAEAANGNAQAKQDAIDAAAAALKEAISNMKTLAKEEAEQKVAGDKEALEAPVIGTGYTFTLITEGSGGSKIVWTSNHDAVQIDGATATMDRGEADVFVMLTATITFGEGEDAVSDTKTFEITVPAEVPGEADKTALNAAIKRAEAFQKEKYTETSWNALQAALEKAQAEASNEQAVQSQVNAKKKALENAIAGLKTRAKEKAEQNAAKDKEALQTPEIGTGGTFTLVTEGPNGSKITWESDDDAIQIDRATATVTRGDAAVTVTLTATITSGEGEDAVSVTKAFTITVPADIPSEADKTALNAAIEQAEEIQKGNYSDTSWNALQAALEEARVAASDNAAEQSQVDAKKKALESAIAGLKTAAKEEAEQNTANDKEALETPEIGTGDTFALVTEGPNGSKITWESDDDAIQIDGATATVMRGDAAVTVTLTATIMSGEGEDAVSVTKTFTITVPADIPSEADKTALNAAIERAEEIQKGNYSDTSWNALQAALQEAKDVAADKTATQSQVNAKKTALELAITGLKTVAKEGAEQNAANDKEALELPEIGTGDTFTLVAEGPNGSKITWASDDDAVQIDGATATITRGDAAVTVTLTATITSGEGEDAVSVTKTFEITVPAKSIAVVANKAALNAVIQRAQGIKKGNYTDSSWDALQKALSEALSASRDANASQSVVDEKKAALEGAISRLAENPKTDISKTAVIILAKESCAYSGKAQQPAVSVQVGQTKLAQGRDYTIAYKNNINVGTASVTVTGIGTYTGTVIKEFKIMPKGTSIKGKITAKKKGFTVKWKKEKKSAAGYEIQYSTDKKFKKATKAKRVKASKTKLSVSKLKAKKKYYVRIRTYKKIGKVYYYSDWSKAKTVKTKK